MLVLFLIAVSVGLSNLAAAIGIGFSGVDRRLRVRVVLVFGAFEAGMPVLGLLIGASAASGLGEAARWLGSALLIMVGGFGLLRALRGRGAEHPVPAAGPGSMGRLMLSALALSMDNLAAGFVLGANRIGVLAGALVVGAVSVALSLIGLELGGRLGEPAGQHSEQIGNVILIGVGVAIAAGVL